MSPPYDSSVFHSISRRAWDRKHARYPKASSNWCVAKLRLTNQLEKHAGCVNSVAWNDDASLLLTGSDDLCVCVWSVGSDFPCRGSIYTGHVHNIFSAEFVPGSGSQKCVTAAGDGDVRLIDLAAGFHASAAGAGASARNAGESPSATRHRPRRRWVTDPDHDSPFAASLFQRRDFFAVHEPGMGMKVKFYDHDVFLTTHQDGKVRRFDLRVPTSSVNGSTGGQRNWETVCDLSTQGSLSDLAFDPTAPTQFAVGCDDPYVRVFDLRRFALPTGRERLSSPSAHGEHPSNLQVVAKYCPGKKTGFNTRRVQFDGVSGLAYSRTGELAVNYRGERLYVIDRYAAEREYKARPHGGILGDVPHTEAGKHVQGQDHSVDGWAMDAASDGVAWTTHPGVTSGHSGVNPQTALASPTALHPSRSPSPEFGYDNGSDEDGDEAGDDEFEDEEDAADRLREIDAHDQRERFRAATERRSASLPRDRAVSQRRSATPGGAAGLVSDGDPWSLFDPDQTLVQNPVVRRFTGHKNVKTFLKSVSFMCDDQYVTTGSDCGGLFVWRKDTGTLVTKLQADSQVVNNVVPHPRLPILVTSGIDDVVRVWEPGEGAHLVPTPNREVDETDELAETMLAAMERGGNFTEVWNRLRRRGESEDEDEDDDDDDDDEDTENDSQDASASASDDEEPSDDEDIPHTHVNMGVPFTRAIRDLVNAEAQAEVARQRRRSGDGEETLMQTEPDETAPAETPPDAPAIETPPPDAPAIETPPTDTPPTENTVPLRRSKRARSENKSV